MSNRRTLALALAFGLGLGLTAFARAADVEITGLKLIIVDNLASTGKAKVVFVSKDPDIVKGPAGDPPGLTGSLEVFYTDATSNMGAFVMPDPWQVNKDTVAKYVNKLAPAGGGVKVATVKPATVAKVVAKSLGDASQIDLVVGGPPGLGGMTVVLTVANAYGEVTRMCTRFPTVSFYETGGGTGRKIVARSGVAAPCPEVAIAETSTPSNAEPEETPGSPGVDANDYPKLVTQFGNDQFSLNNATYTRYHYAPLDGTQPDAILVLVPGFEGGAGSLKILAENLITHARVAGLNVELWALDRRGHQIEDREGIAIAAAAVDPLIALDWLYGGELGLTLHPALVAGPNRRAIFHDAQADTAFIANWTGLVFSRDIDAVVEAARAVAKNQNVFLGGHSAGTGFTARYASTDFDLGGGGPAEPGYAKVRGLVLLEGGGGSTGGTPLTPDSLDRIEDRADGGLFEAVDDNAPRCVDGTPCTFATEATDCAGKGKGKCTDPTAAYAIVPGLLNPRILAAPEPQAIQAITDPDGGESILRVDQGPPGNNAIDQVPDLAILGILIPHATAMGGLGIFLDDDGIISASATFVRTSLGGPGPVVGGLVTWLDLSERASFPACPGAGCLTPDNGPAPTTYPPTPPATGVWGQEKEVTRMDRVLTTFYEGGTNFTDWYYPSSGLATTTAPGVCSGTTAGSTCLAGKVGAPCSGANQSAANAQCTQSVSLDSTALSVGRGRRDIENLTQAAAVNVPVIAFGGSNGLTPVPASYLAFAQSIGTCTAPSCDGTPRVVDASNPNPAFPTFGDVNGGYEVHISEGYAHVDIVTAEDDADNDVVAPLIAFIARNVQ